MSYNYDECVSTIDRHRHDAYHHPTTAAAAPSNTSAPPPPPPPDLDALSLASEAFATLSSQCPMTPLLWMKYAHDVEEMVRGSLLSSSLPSEETSGDEEARTQGLEIGLDTSELGLVEFPGCAALRLHHLEKVCESFRVGEEVRRIKKKKLEEQQQQQQQQRGMAEEDAAMVGPALPPPSEDDNDEQIKKIVEAFESALRYVGLGSHAGEGRIVAEIYRRYGSFLLCLLETTTMTTMVCDDDDDDGRGKQQQQQQQRRQREILTQLCDILIRRSRTATSDGANDGLVDEASLLYDEAASLVLRSPPTGDASRVKTALEKEKSSLLARMDNERRRATSVAAALGPCGNGVELAMAAEYVLLPPSLLDEDDDEEEDGSGRNGDDGSSKYLQRLKRSSHKWTPLLVGTANANTTASLASSSPPAVAAVRCLMGLGGSETTKSFLRYVKFLERRSGSGDIGGRTTKKGKADDDNGGLSVELVESLLVPVHERAISECPTAEAVWTSYLSCLKRRLREAREAAESASSAATTAAGIDKSTKDAQTSQEADAAAQTSYNTVAEVESLLRSASNRAVRNCPYAPSLFEAKMEVVELLSCSKMGGGSGGTTGNHNGQMCTSSFEPDDVTAVVREATELGFLNANREAALGLRLAAIRISRRRLLSLVSLGTTTTTTASSLESGGDGGSGGKGKDFDDEEATEASSPDANKKRGKRNKKNKKGGKEDDGTVLYRPLPPLVAEEAIDLAEDIRDMYDDADAHLFQHFPDWIEGRVSFWRDRSESEAYVLSPLMHALREDGDDGSDDEVMDDGGNHAGALRRGDEAVRCFEKLVKAQKPSHPDAWRDYVRYVGGRHALFSSRCVGGGADGTADVSAVMRRTRGLYRRAMSSVRKAAGGTMGVDDAVAGKYRDDDVAEAAMAAAATAADVAARAIFGRGYDVALSDLCREYLEFERRYGTEETLEGAMGLVRSKLEYLDVDDVADVAPPKGEAGATADGDGTNGKRKERETVTTKDEGNDDHDVAMEKDGDAEESSSSRTKRMKVKTDLKQPKNTDGVHKVHIGKMDYPAHPYTVHVSNIDDDATDIDLVDAFRPSCGGVVHAKIIREKHFGKGGHHHHGKSKGAGLIQFEERSSVERALEASGTIEVGGKAVTVRRSHVPAVGVVPPGMHRVNPKGGGKVSKRNFQKKMDNHKQRWKDGAGGAEADAMECDEEKPKGKSTFEASKNVTETKPVSSAVVGSPTASLSLDVLSFQPRGLKNRKPKIALGDTKKALAKK